MVQNIFLKTKIKVYGAQFIMITHHIKRRVKKKLLFLQHIVNSKHFLDFLHYINLKSYTFIVKNMTLSKDGRFSENGLKYKDWVHGGYVDC